MKHFVLLTIIGLFNTGALASEPAFNCTHQRVAYFSPGPNWEKLGETIPEHLGFISAQLKNGNLLSAGPLTDTEGKPTGGLAVFNVLDMRALEQLLQEDALVARKIVNVTIKPWQMCR
jgi:uncharacterized protein YciI